MEFNNSQEVESIVWTMRLADYPRSLNRTKIDDMLNGVPPYSDDEVRANQIAVNVNPLGGTRLAHEGRSQYNNAFMKPGKFFHARTDYGPKHKRSEYNTVVTSEASRIMKRSNQYFETNRSAFAMLIAHGIGPAGWDDKHKWCSDEIGIGDLLIPSNTTLKMKNLPFYAIYRNYTGAQLRKLTSGPKVDPGWNMPLVNHMIEWVDGETAKLLGTTWPEVWSPERAAERIKSDGGMYASDAVPTIDVYDFRYFSDEGKESGWRRRIVLDAYGTLGVGGEAPTKGANRYGEEAKGFLYNSKKRKFAGHLSEQICFQFADLSAVAPFRYHSVRGLGFIIWAVCHLQNRLYCKGMEATFEQLTQYMRVKSMDDVERALKVELVNRGFIDESINFVPANERWQTNMALLEYAYGTNERIISENASSYVQNQSMGQDKVEKTKFQVMAETNAMTSLVSAGLLQAYQYKTFEYREIFRRFCRPNSNDPDVREFRNNCLKAGVPEEVLVPEAWDISAEQVMGAGNKTLEMSISQQLMAMRNLYDPEPQRKILRDVTLAITDSSAKTEELVPDEPLKVTDSVHDAQLSVPSLMMGLPVSVRTGQNHIEIAETWIGELALMVHEIETQGGMTTAEKIKGFQNVAKHISEQIQLIAQDPEEKDRVKEMGDHLGKIMNLVKAYQQRLEQQMKKAAQQNGNGAGGIDAETQAKLKGKLLIDQAKAANMRESHGARTAQKQIQWELDQKRKQEEHKIELQREAEKHHVEMGKRVHETHVGTAMEGMKTAAEIKHSRMKAFSEDKDE